MEHTANKRKQLLLVIAGLILVAMSACFLIVRFYLYRDYGTTLDLKKYVTLGWNGAGEPTALLDVDAILTDLHLPSPHNDAMAEQKYPDVRALLSMQLYLTYTDDPDTMQVIIRADTDTLESYGIRIETLSWPQQLKGYVAGEDPLDFPAFPLQPAVTASPAPRTPAGTYLTALTDANGDGYNLRAVCERVQRERDLLCRETFRDIGYQTTKIQVTFSVGNAQARYRNCYQASYRVVPDGDGTTQPEPLWFRIRLYNLIVGEDGTVGFDDRADVEFRAGESECKRPPSADQYSTVTLSGGGVRVRDKAAFDQNGFVIFSGCPTSYRMANGLYWSPTYDALTEDMVWKLTAVDGHSLANLLRYARKEIYARYHTSFDPRSEREFAEHYGRYPWFLASDDDRSIDMTETDRANIRLLREIQSLVEK